MSVIGQGRIEPGVADCLRTLNLCPTPYTIMFFSEANCNVLQATLKKKTAERTGYMIDKQDPKQLMICMQSAFKWYGREPACNEERVVCGAVAVLNAAVVDLIGDSVANGVLSYLRYLKNVSSPLVPPPMPQATSIAGTKPLPIFPAV